MDSPTATTSRPTLTCMTQTKAAPPNMPPGGDAVDAHCLGETRVQRCIYGKTLLRAWRVGLRSCATGVACLCKLTFVDFARSPLYSLRSSSMDVQRRSRGSATLPRHTRGNASPTCSTRRYGETPIVSLKVGVQQSP